MQYFKIEYKIAPKQLKTLPHIYLISRILTTNHSLLNTNPLLFRPNATRKPFLTCLFIAYLFHIKAKKKSQAIPIGF